MARSEFWLNWDFTMIAVGVTPFLLFFVSRFKKGGEEGDHTRYAKSSRKSSLWCSRAWNPCGRKPSGRQDMEPRRIEGSKSANVSAALAAAREVDASRDSSGTVALLARRLYCGEGRHSS